MTYDEYPRAAALDVLTTLMLNTSTPPRIRMECAQTLLDLRPEPLTTAYDHDDDQML